MTSVYTLWGEPGSPERRKPGPKPQPKKAKVPTASLKRECQVCGTVFTQPNHGTRAKTCPDPKCKAERVFLYHFGADHGCKTFEEARALELATRSRCVICDDLVPRKRINKRILRLDYAAFCESHYRSAQANIYVRARHYGATPEWARELSQKTRCDVCDKPLDVRGGGRFVHVDHRHGTDIVRGVLCFKCNLAGGHAGEDPARLRALAAFYERGSGNV
jgi:hypothetical protein